MANEMNYRDVLGKTNGALPSAVLGRGLVKMDEVCEFQTAMVSREEQFYNFIKPYMETLNSRGYSKAPEIYIMPEIVEVEKMKDKYTGINSVPVGIYKDSLNSALFDFAKRTCTVVSASEFDFLTKFVRNLVDSINKGSGFLSYFIDANNLYETYEYKTPYLNDKFNEFVDSLAQANDKVQAILVENNIWIKSLKKIATKFF